MLKSAYLRTAVLLTVCFFVSGCYHLKTGTKDWPMYRFDAGRTASSPEKLPDELNLLWVREYPRLEQTWDDPLNQDLMQFDRVYEPVVYSGTLFIGSNAADCLIALSVDTGEERWRYYADGPVRFPAAAAEGRVYFTSDDGYLYCLEAESGDLLWKFQGAPAERVILGNERLISTWPARGGPVLQDGAVYFAAGIWPFMGIFIYAVDAETGAVIWENDGTGSRYMLQPHNSPAYAGVAPQGHLVIAGDRLLVPGGRSVPACFDLNTGEFLYYRLAENGKTGGAFVAARGDFFVNYHRDSVVSLYQLSDGESVLPRFGRVPVLTEDRLFCRGNSISAFDLGNLRVTGTSERVVFSRDEGSIETVEEKKWVLDPLWSLDVDASGDLIRAGNKLYAGGKGILSAVSLPGWWREPEVSWQVKVEGTVARVLAAGGKLFAVTLEGRIYAFGEYQVETPRFHPDSPEVDSLPPEALARAHSILSSSGVREGYCLVYGAENEDLIAALLESSDLRVIAIEADPEKVETIRRRFDGAGLHGKRFSVHPGTADDRLPPYLASLVVIENLEDLEGLEDGHLDSFLQELYQALRPYGGTAYISMAGDPSDSLQERISELGLEGAKVRRIEYAPTLLEGVRHAGRRFESEDSIVELRAEIDLAAALVESDGDLLLIRSGALPGSGSWTHQYGSMANTVKSDDQLVKLPLGVLWFGGSSNQDVLPRHGHGPPEQVIGGRLFIEGMHGLSARDVYTGRVLWKREFSRLNTNGIYYDETYKDTPLDTSYNQVHIPGANARGTNFVATEDRVYLVLERGCVVLDPATGQTIDEFSLPPEHPGEETPKWAYIGVYGDYLVGGADFVSYLELLELDELDPQMTARLNSFYNFDIAASRRLIVMNRYTGEVLWSRRATLGFWHNAISAGDDTIFCVDRLAPSVGDALKQRSGRYHFPPSELMALRIDDGAVRWRNNRNIFGTWLGFSKEHGLLVQAGRSSRDMLRGEPKGISVHRVRDGSLLWKDESISDGGPYILHGEWIITENTAYSLITGKQRMRIDPLTEERRPWVYRRDYGCNYVIGSENLLTFRSAAAGFLDLETDGGTGTFGGFRSSCTSNLISADGLLNAPDYTRTCSCSYQNQTSLALIHMPELDLWTTYYSRPEATSVSETDIPVVLADADLNLTYGNAPFRQLFGLDEELEIDNVAIEDLVRSPEGMREVLDVLGRQRRWKGLLEIRKSDGTFQEVYLRARVLSDESFSPAAAIFLFTDAADSATAFLDGTGELTYVDEPFLELWLLQDEREALKLAFEELWMERDEAAEAIGKVRIGEDWEGELTAVRDDGSTKDVDLIAYTVRDENERPISSVISCYDVTELKQIEAEASRLIRELGSGRNIAYFVRQSRPIRRVGINFGAPGDRKEENGSLWLEWPTNGGPSPEVEIEVVPEDGRNFSHHSSWVLGSDPKWVFSSGMFGLSELTVQLENGEGRGALLHPCTYDLYLYFVEPEDVGSGERLLDVTIQGEPILNGLDIVAEAGGPRIGLVKKFRAVVDGGKLTLRLSPSAGSRIGESVISGMEVIARD